MISSLLMIVLVLGFPFLIYLAIRMGGYRHFSILDELKKMDEVNKKKDDSLTESEYRFLAFIVSLVFYMLICMLYLFTKESGW